MSPLQSWTLPPANTLEALKRVRTLLQEPEHWCKYTFAKDEHGTPTQPTSPNAVCLCLRGAMRRAVTKGLGSQYYLLDGRLKLALGDPRLSHFNDNSTHAEIIGLLDKAIQMEMHQMEMHNAV